MDVTDLAVAASAAAVTDSVPDVRELEVRGLSKAFQPDRPIVRDVRFEVARGESVALIGANGAGKSTLLRCCARLIEPDSGSIRLFDEELTRLPPREVRRLRTRIGFVFQRHNLVPRLSAISNVVHGTLGSRRGPAYWLHSLTFGHVREEAMQCLDLVGLGNMAAQRADRLSGGQSQRVAIARALMQRPQLILADEPVASLDPVAGEEVMALFVRLIRREGLTLFFTSHNLDHALRYADRVLGLRGGRIALDAPSSSLRPSGLRGIYD